MVTPRRSFANAVELNPEKKKKAFMNTLEYSKSIFIYAKRLPGTLFYSL